MEMSSRPIAARARFGVLLARALVVAAASGAAAAVEPPRVEIERTAPDLLRVGIDGGVRASGYNLYRDEVYLKTVRPPPGAGAFAVRVGTPGGRFCAVAFEESAAGTDYSRCSASVAIAPGDPDEPVAVPAGAPGAPTRFRGTAYSPGVLETFWDASPDESRLAGYALSRDGKPIAFIRGRSVFETGLEPGRLYDYELVAVGENGVRSEPLSLSLGTDYPRRPASGRTLYTSPERLVLVEGETSGLDVTLTFRRSGEDRRPLALSLLDERGGPVEDIAVRFEPAELAGEEDTARLNLSLPIAMAPRLPERRTLLLRVDDGARVVDTSLELEIEPTGAPDVYLLIGQGNMAGRAGEGSKRAGAGQPDEPLERLRQLHVRANNARFFPTAADYVDEASNIAEPLFIRAEDPLHERLRPGRPAKSGNFIGSSLSFGKAALADTLREVYLVPAAWGATGFCASANGARAWNAVPTGDPALGGTSLLDRALVRLDVTLRESGGILRGILWHQGGADSNDPRCAAAYEDNLVAMVERLRREARPDARGEAARGPNAPVPFVVATQSRGIDERGDFSVYNPDERRVDTVHRQVAELLPHADVVINDDLVPPAYPCGQGSCVHFGAAALREQGARFHAALERVRARHRATRPLATSANDGAR